MIFMVFSISHVECLESPVHSQITNQLTKRNQTKGKQSETMKPNQTEPN